MNRRSAWVLSGLAVTVLTLSAVTLGATNGQFGFGGDDATAGEPAEQMTPGVDASSVAGASVDDGADPGDGDDWDDDERSVDHHDDDRDDDHDDDGVHEEDD